MVKPAHRSKPRPRVNWSALLTTRGVAPRFTLTHSTAEPTPTDRGATFQSSVRRSSPTTCRRRRLPQRNCLAKANHPRRSAAVFANSDRESVDQDKPAWGCRGYSRTLGTPAVRSESVQNARSARSNCPALRSTRGVTPRFTLTRASNPRILEPRPWALSDCRLPTVTHCGGPALNCRAPWPSAAWHPVIAILRRRNSLGG